MNDLHNKTHESNDWENGTLGASEQFVKKASPEKESALDEKLGLQIISIRLQKELINDLKILANKAGLGYQPYIRQLLTKHVSDIKRQQKKHLKAL